MQPRTPNTELAHLTPAEMGFKVTVGIALICEKKKCIVVVSDMKTSFDGLFSADEMSVKNKSLIRNWTILQAGNDVTDADPIIEHARATLRAASAPTPEEVAEAMHRAFQERRNEQIESQILSKYGFTADSFLRDGKRKLTDLVFNRICERINSTELSLEFLVCGFDGAGVGHIFYVDGQRKPASYDDPGFCTIGSGSHAAHSALAFHGGRTQLSPYCPWQEAVYCSCDAKFRAEAATDVGRSTFLTIHRSNREVQFISPLRIEQDIRKRWDKLGAHRLASSILRLLPDLVFSAGSFGTEDGFRRFVGNNKRLTRTHIDREFTALQRMFALHDTSLQ